MLLLTVGCQLTQRSSPVGGVGFGDTRTNSYEVAGQPRPITELRVSSDAGDIEVVGHGSGPVRVVEELHYEKEPPRTHHKVRQGVLSLRYDDCGDDCWVDYRIEVPARVATVLHNGAGDITLRGMAGRIEATTGAGDLTARRLRSRRATLRTSAGNVDVAFASAPSSVDAVSSAGNLTVRLPGGTYAVRAATTVGDAVVGVHRASTSPRTIHAETQAGDVRVLPA